MLAVEPLRGSNGEEGALGSFSIGGDETFGDEAFLDDVSFGDLFMGIDVDGDVLPDLELDPAEIFAEFSVGSAEAEESATSATAGAVDPAAEGLAVEVEAEAGEGNKEATRGEEVVSAAGKEETAASLALTEESNKSRKPSPEAKSSQSQGKRKAKVDWTPELHRRFVQAVEQLGIDKAVPSRILELMGIDCLTRHNIASHLQKYRSHRKHLLAREAEAASWSQRRQIYSGGGGGCTGSGAKRPDINPWLQAPTIGFPPRHPPPPPPPTQVQPFRPLHVWGHPTVGEGAPMPAPPHVWLRHLAPRSPTPTQPWPAAQPPLDPSYWHHHYPRGIVPQAMTQGTPCFPQPLPAARFSGAAMPGIVPHHPIYSAIPPPPLAVLSKLSNSELQLDAYPSVESIDAAIGDVLAKPWLPLPLGLKPPAVDSVLVELQKHGVSKVPPSRA